MSRKTHRSKSHKRRHSRRHTRKRGGSCPCSQRGQWGGRGGLGGADVGHAFTTGASQTLYQMTGQTPGLSSGGAKGSKARARTRNAMLARRAEQRAANLTRQANRLEQQANRLENRANALEARAEQEAHRATTLRANAPNWEPNNVKLNRALAAKQIELMELTNNYNNNNNKASKNFNRLMNMIHKKRMNNND
jgi:hypothetical protein